MNGNQHLHKARIAKKDEFYTQLKDIQNELVNYTNHFKDKIVLCNCDNPAWSNFWKYFHLNFSLLRLKKLVSTHYETNEETYKMEYTGGHDEDITEGTKTPLKGNGDFRSTECKEILKECDIVVTNPPFSLFREYLAQLMEYDKNFLILGNMNVVTYKHIFPLFKNNKIWYGASLHSGGIKFSVPEYYSLESTDCGIDENGQHYIKVPVRWFTNLDYAARHTAKLTLTKKYTPEKYTHYDNYDAINVDKYADIPCDYDGVMGVPITFMDFYCPDQFEIIGLGKGRNNFTPNKTYVNPKRINHGKVSNGSSINCLLVYSVDSVPKKGIYYTADNCDKMIFAPYARILIKKKPS